MVQAAILLGSFFEPLHGNFEAEAGGIGGDKIAIFDRWRAGQAGHFFQWYARCGDPFRPFAPDNRGHGKGKVLAVGVVHAGMGDDGNAGGLGNVTDFDHAGNAAAPKHIRLEDIDQPVAGGGSKGVGEIPMFAGG